MTVDLEEWRGVAADTDEEIPSAVSVLLRRRTRSTDRKEYAEDDGHAERHNDAQQSSL